MRPTRPARLAAAALAVAVLAACSSGDATEDPTPTDTTTASATPTADETTTSTSPSPTETGTEGMTVEEAQEIVDATTAVYNDAVIRMLTEQRIGQQWYEQMRNIYSDTMVELIEAGWFNAAKNQYEDYNTSDPTGVVDEVIEVTEERGDCFAVRIRRDFNGVTADDAEGAIGVTDRYFIAFHQATEEARDGAGTGWLRTWDVRSEDEDLIDLCQRENPGLGEEGE